MRSLYIVNLYLASIYSTKLIKEIRLDVLAQSLPAKAFTQTTINLEKARTVWVATIIKDRSGVVNRLNFMALLNPGMIL